MPVLRVENIDAAYSGRKVLSDISFRVESGEIYALLGPNGSGKTTLIKTICRLVKPLRGEIHLNGDRLDRMPHEKLARTVAVVPQVSRVEFSFSSFDVVAMGRNPYQNRLGFDKSEDREIVIESMKATDCLHLSERPFNQLSGGEAQRVVLARCIAQRAKLLLLDEPTSHLDIKYQIEIFRLLKELRRERNITILISTHDLNLASANCDRMLMIKNGARAAEGLPKDVITEENVKKVFGADTRVDMDSETGLPIVKPKI